MEPQQRETMETPDCVSWLKFFDLFTDAFSKHYKSIIRINFTHYLVFYFDYLRLCILPASPLTHPLDFVSWWRFFAFLACLLVLLVNAINKLSVLILSFTYHSFPFPPKTKYS